jgi:hypothetical protein
MAKSVKVVLMMILGLGIFAGGYFWGMNVRDKVRDKEPKATSSTSTGEMQGMGSMEGMPGMSPGIVMVSQQNQQLLGIKVPSWTGEPWRKPSARLAVSPMMRPE